MNTQTQKGFTLIETLVTMTLFMTALIIMGSAFVGVVTIQRKAFNVQQVEENGSFIVETMAKEMRVSQINAPNGFNCPTVSGTINQLCITHPINGQVKYYFNSAGDGNLHRVANGVDTILNSNKIRCIGFTFTVSGSALADGLQPRVTMTATIQSINTLQQATINIQTTVSQRSLDT